MPVRVFLVLLLAVACPVQAADDFDVLKLEQDVRNLERRVQDLSRQVEDLKQKVARTGPAATRARGTANSPRPATDWLDAANWRRVKPGMSELEVIGILGLPTSMRSADDGARLLLYVTEIGSSGFLSGRVTLRDSQVTEVSEPRLM